MADKLLMLSLYTGEGALTIDDTTRAAVHEPPKNGLLSGMVVTWATALAAVAAGLFVARLHPYFAQVPSHELVSLYVASIVLMCAHKVESYWTGEFEQCPVYETLARAPWASDVRRATFAVFCSMFLAAMFLSYLVLRGAPWPLLLMSVWCAQGLHEIHHGAKSLARQRYYPGTTTALLFTLFMDLSFFPVYAGHLGGLPPWWIGLYYAAQPLLFAAFYVEDRQWLARRAAYDEQRTLMVASATSGVVV